MKAVVYEGGSGIGGLALRDMPPREPSAGEVRVRMKTAGLNHRDLRVLSQRTLTDPPLILGSDGAGEVDALGEGVTNVRLGDEVMINPGLGWRHTSAAPPAGFEILGHPSHGTFAEFTVVPAENVVRKPAYLTWEEAGVLSLAALTAYRVLFTRARVQPGMNLLIPGIGSGVATFLLQFAKAAGAEVAVTSRSQEKRERAIKLGAAVAIDSNSDWNEALCGKKYDVVIESVGAATFDKSIHQLQSGGTIVAFGASAGDEVTIDIRHFFYGQFNLLGSTMGSAQEYQEMLDFIEARELRPVMDAVYPLAEFGQAFRRMDLAGQFGKIALVIA